MTRWIALVPALAAGCGVHVVTEFGGRDAGDADVPEVGDAAPEQAAKPDCPGKQAAPTSSLRGACDGGRARYGTDYGVCPIGAVGSCSVVVPQSAITNYGEVCCEHAACVRAAFGDPQCQAQLDGTPIPGANGLMMWECPWGNGKPSAQPPGRCSLYAPAVADSTRVDYCCR